jgi:hypothetical protein
MMVQLSELLIKFDAKETSEANIKKFLHEILQKPLLNSANLTFNQTSMKPQNPTKQFTIKFKAF